MGNELTLIDKDTLARLTKKLNSPPRDVFPDRKAPEYGEWFRSLKPGDMVWYDEFMHYHSHRRITKVKSTTKTGMVRLDDGVLVSAEGYIKGQITWKLLQPYNEDYVNYERRMKALSKLSDYAFKNLTNAGLSLVMEAIMRAEDMVPKELDSSEK